MFRFSREQSVVNVAGVRMGGQPGELPTALAGTIFYHGQRIVDDEERGIFDRSRAEEMVSRQASLSQETGNPAILHIFARTAAAFERYMEFAESLWDGPVIADSSDPAARSAIAGYVSEVGYADRIIYNSISIGSTPEEIRALKESEVDSAILLAFNPSESGVDGRIKMLESGEVGPGIEGGLIPLARGLGLANLLLDPGVAPMGDGAGAALRFSVVAKARFGLPVGSGMHNAASSWPWLREQKAIVRRCCDAAASALQQLASGDFILYGPIEAADVIFPVAAMADILISEAAMDLDVWPIDSHPVQRLV